MRTAIQATTVFVIHVAFLFAAYGSHLFGLALPYNLVIAIWLGASSLLAAAAYYEIFSLLKNDGAHVVSTIAATCASLFTGVFLAFNTYGT